MANPNVVARQISDKLATAPGGRIGFVSQSNNVGVWDTFWSKVYSVDAVNNAANKVIKAGQVTREKRDGIINAASNTVDAAGRSLNFVASYGPIIVFALVILYVYSWLPKHN